MVVSRPDRLPRLRSAQMSSQGQPNVHLVHAYDLGPVLDRHGVAVRTGHHCAEPVMDRFGVPATVRASLAFYNTRSEIDQLVTALEKAKTFF